MFLNKVASCFLTALDFLNVSISTEGCFWIVFYLVREFFLSPVFSIVLLSRFVALSDEEFVGDIFFAKAALKSMRHVFWVWDVAYYEIIPKATDMTSELYL